MKYTIEDLKEAVKEGDNEHIHSMYDKLIMDIALKHDHQAVKKLDDMVKGINFWYA